MHARPAACLVWLFLLALCLGAGAPPAPAQQPLEPPAAAEAPIAPATGPQIERWVAELDSDEFLVREAATQKLLTAGAAALPPLEKLLGEGSAEATARAIYVLRELALSPDLNTEEAARGLLERVAAERGGALARRAAGTLQSLDRLRHERAVADLTRLGAKVATRQVHNGAFVVEQVTSIEIGPEWRGQDQDLRRLKWIREIPQLILIGEQVTDGWIELAAGMEHLQSLHVKRARITDAGVAAIKRLPRLVDLAIYYTPVGDGAAQHVKECAALASVRLYGTRVTRGAADALQEALAAAKVDFRQGGFLGVGCQAAPQGCLVAVVHENSAADKAGIEAGDIITRFAGQEVASFEGLTAIISRHTAGETVAVETLRGEEKKSLQLTLGEWE